MKINIDRSPEYLEPEIIIKCSEITEELQRLISMLKGSEEKVQGIQDGNTYLIEPEDIFYFESVDKKTFMYTHDAVLETPLRLYEIEEKLSNHDFFRASKSTVINISKIKKLSPKFNGKLDVLLENDEKLVISRQYVHVIKEILGL
jgi:DNA-binding LytR/AlgR family response regulator